MALIRREAAVQKRGLTTDTVPVPEFGGEFRVKAFGEADRERYDRRSNPKTKQGREFKRTLLARIIIENVIDENDQPLFTEADIPVIVGTEYGWNSGIVQRVAGAIMAMSGGGVNEVDEIEKN